MRLRVAILGCGLVSAFASLSMITRSGSSAGTTSSSASSVNLLCNEGRIICVSQSAEYSLISSPLKVAVEVNSSDDIQLGWEVNDSTGQTLESGSTYECPVEAAVKGTSKRFDITDYVLQPSKSDSGRLVLSPSRFNTLSGKTDLPKLKIPVRLDTATTVLTILLPKNSHEYQGEVITSINEGEADFVPKTPLVPQSVTVMKVEKNGIMAATAEAVLRAMPGQSPYHVTGFDVHDRTAHVKISGNAWAGVSFYWRSISFLVKKSLLQFPNIREVVFD